MKGTTLRSLCLCPKLPGLRAFRRESLPQKGIWGHGVLEATVDSDLAGRGSPRLREGRPDTEGPGEPVRPPPRPRLRRPAVQSLVLAPAGPQCPEHARHTVETQRTLKGE